MARNDPYLPTTANVTAGSNTTFDGSASSTDTAIMSGAMATFDAEIYIEAYDGDVWQTVTQLADADGDTTFSENWHTQFNRVYLSTNDRRVRVENVGDSDGYVAVEGDER